MSDVRWAWWKCVGAAVLITSWGFGAVLTALWWAASWAGVSLPIRPVSGSAVARPQGEQYGRR